MFCTAGEPKKSNVRGVKLYNLNDIYNAYSLNLTCAESNANSFKQRLN